MKYVYQSGNETHVYISDSGYVCVKQTDLVYAEDQIVCLTPHQAEWLARILPDMAMNASQEFNANDGDDYAAKA